MVCVGVSVIVPVAFVLFNVCVWIVIGCVSLSGLAVFFCFVSYVCLCVWCFNVCAFRV